MIILRFTRSFYGQEDMALFDRLRPELPGILRWAIAGWERLNRRGRFLQPHSAGELVATMDELASPIAAFLRDRCVVEPDATCPVAAMYESWRSWCQEHGRDAVGDEHSFGRDLHAAIPGLATIRPRTSLGARVIIRASESVRPLISILGLGLTDGRDSYSGPIIPCGHARDPPRGRGRASYLPISIAAAQNRWILTGKRHRCVPNGSAERRTSLSLRMLSPDETATNRNGAVSILVPAGPMRGCLHVAELRCG